MTATPLPAVEKSCGLDIESALPAVLARKLPQDRVAVFCKLYRRMAVAKLLVSGEPDAFFADLSRGAHAYLYFLERADPAQLRTSLSEPFFDAIACRDDAAAGAIARASRPSWNQGEEYEEDFLYVWFLMSRFVLAAPADELAALLARWEAALQGTEDLRLDLCRALHARDQDLLDRTLATLVDDRRRADRKKIDAERMPPDDVPTLAKVWVELLALLRLAEAAGLRTEPELPLAPSIARRLDLARLPDPSSWKTIGSYREIT